MTRDRRPEELPRLPIVPGPVSNGEFFPLPPSGRDRWVAQEALLRAAQAADHLGMDRRRFLQTTGGVATMLGVINLAACSSGNDGAAPRRPSTTAPTTTSTTVPGGPSRCPSPPTGPPASRSWAPRASSSSTCTPTT